MGRMKFLLFCKYIRKALRKHLKHGLSKDFQFRGIKKQTIHILGNGPSLVKSLNLIREGDAVVMVNYSVLTELFQQLKPNYLCLADPGFFQKTTTAERKKEEMFRVFNVVDWELVIVVPFFVGRNVFPVENKNISFKYVNTIPLDFSIHLLRYWLYKKNLSMPSLQNVIIMGVYIAIQQGYQTILLHGVDSNSYKNICINEHNEMVMREHHYYEVEDRNLNDEMIGFSARTLYKRLMCEVNMFRAYIDLSDYAKSIGISIINASPESMIDAFERYDFKTKKRKNTNEDKG